MDYLLFYWAFSSLFAYGFWMDLYEFKSIGNHLVSIIFGCIIGWLIFPIMIGHSMVKIGYIEDIVKKLKK